MSVLPLERTWAIGSWLPEWYWAEWQWGVPFADALLIAGSFTRQHKVELESRARIAKLQVPVDEAATQRMHVAELGVPAWRARIKVKA